MFSGRWTFLVFFMLVICLQGCETLKGAQKDVTNTWQNLNQEDGWLKKTDNWMKENLW